MIFLGVGKIKKKDGKLTERAYIVEITETEADQITGVAGRPHIAGRYKAGVEVNITSIYKKVKRINEKHAKIKAAAIALQADAADMAKAIPLT